MTKFLNKWLRKFHRWLALPFIALVLTANFAQGTPLGDSAKLIEPVVTISLAIGGAYLWLSPYLAKWKRQKAQARS